MWKRFLLVLLLLALIGGGYRARPAGLMRPSIPIGSGSSKQLRNTLVGLSGDADLQRALAEGRKQTLGIPSVRESILVQSLHEQQAMAADPATAAALMDLQVSVLEQANFTPAHDRRLSLLLMQALELAAEDPDLRPILAQTFEKILRDSDSRHGSRSTPEGTRPQR